MRIVIYQKIPRCWWEPWTWSGWRKTHGGLAFLLLAGCQSSTAAGIREREPVTIMLNGEARAVAVCILDEYDVDAPARFVDRGATGFEIARAGPAGPVESTRAVITVRQQKPGVVRADIRTRYDIAREEALARVRACGETR